MQKPTVFLRNKFFWLILLSVLLAAFWKYATSTNPTLEPANTEYTTFSPAEVGELFLISLQKGDWKTAYALCSEGYVGGWQKPEELKQEEEVRVSRDGALLNFYLKEETASGNLYTLDYYTSRPGFKGRYSSAFLIGEKPPDEKQLFTLKLSRYEKLGWKVEGYYTTNVVTP